MAPSWKLLPSQKNQSHLKMVQVDRTISLDQGLGLLDFRAFRF